MSPHHFHPLEPRRLLSLGTFGQFMNVPVPSTDIELPYGPLDFDVVAAGDGSRYIVATATFIGSSNSIRAVRFSAQGEQLGEPLPLQLGDAGTELAAAMDADGDAVVAYMRWDDRDAGVGGIDVSRISKDGIVAPPLRVSPPRVTGEELLSPAVAMDDAGGFFVGWVSDIDHGNSGTTASVHIRAYHADGTPRAAEIVTSSEFGLSAFFGDLVLAANPDGSGAVFAHVFENEVNNGVTFGRVSETALIHKDVTFRAGSTQLFQPAVAVQEDGSYVLAYTIDPSDADEPEHVFALRFSATDVEQGAPIVLDESLPIGGEGVEAAAEFPDLAMLPDGGFVATFVHDLGGVSTVYARRYDRSGAADAAGPVFVAVTESFSGGMFLPDIPPAIAADDHGQLVVACEGAISIFAQRLTANVGVIDDSILLVPSGGSADDDITVRSGDGDTYIVRNGDEEQSFDARLVRGLRVTTYAGHDVIINDTPLKSTLEGGSGNDTIRGGSNTDIIRGEHGDDSLFGAAGEDLIYGFTGNDSLSGGDGRDLLYGETGRDSLSGNAGYDFLDGGPNADRVAGNGGRDRVQGGSGNDRLFGGAQTDSLFGGQGEDHLNGDNGHDRLYGDTGDDTLYGGTGDDVLVSRDALLDHLFGGRGEDSAVADEDDVLAGVETIQ